jgi:hypothetical protein
MREIFIQDFQTQLVISQFGKAVFRRTSDPQGIFRIVLMPLIISFKAVGTAASGMEFGEMEIR